ncbi:MAG: guanylate kinase [Planctomycetota bacterium]|jgi:guanylate kinase
MMADSGRGKLVVVSGPSGAGKTTVLKRVFDAAPVPLAASVSATTRPPRPGEADGVDYHFLTREEFERRRRRGDFLECFQVFGKDCWYGTLQSEVAPSLEAGKWVILDIDVQGALSVMERYPEAVTIFVQPSSLEVLEERLRGRRTESEQAVQSRLRRAPEELAMADCYTYQVINDDVDQAVREICDILTRSGG